MNRNLIALVALSLTLNGCVDLNDPYYPSSTYGGGYGNSYPYGYGSGSSYQDRRERERLERERDRLEDERERLERERERHDTPSYRPPPPPPERCPAGFSPSEQKCSHEERKRGCQDMRLPGGLGCVRR